MSKLITCVKIKDVVVDENNFESRQKNEIKSKMPKTKLKAECQLQINENTVMVKDLASTRISEATFDHVFREKAKNKDIFDVILSDDVNAFIANCKSYFVYNSGPSNAGKVKACHI